MATKPYADFPLTAHPNGQWYKRIKGKLYYFGTDADEALQRYLAQRDDLYAGRRPADNDKQLTVADLCNHFLTDRELRIETGELRKRTFQDYLDVCKKLAAKLGRTTAVEHLRPEDFAQLRAAFAKGRGPVTLGNLVRVSRMVFKYGYDAGLLEKPVRFGPSFNLPSKRLIRADRHAKGPRMFESEEIRTLLENGDVSMRAMILLGVCCGYGNHDVGQLPLSAVDLQSGWASFPRPKTAIERRAKLWPEAVEAVHASLQIRPTPRDQAHEGLVFITKYGNPWFRDSMARPLSAEFRKILDTCGICKPGQGFYSLRRTFETIAGAARDQIAVDHIMGHSDPFMAAVYRQRIDDERLERVAEHVRKWLFG